MSVEGNQQYPAAPPQQYAPAPPQPPQPHYAVAPQYPQYSGAYAAKPATLPITIVSMCLGIAAVTFGWIFIGFGLALGIAAIVCGHVGMRQLAKSPQPKAGKGFAIAGLVTGYAGIAFGLAYIGFMVFFFTVMVAAGA